MAYNGTIDVISGLRPKNNGTFPLVSAKDIQVADDDTRLDAALQSAKEQAEAVNVAISSLQKTVETQGKNIDNNAIDIVSLKEDVENLKNNSGSTGGVSSWNDLTDKPFYSESSEEVAIESQEVTSYDEGGMFTYAMEITEELAKNLLTIGTEIKLVIDDEEYISPLKNTVVGTMTIQGYGNTEKVLGIGDTGEPFCCAPSYFEEDNIYVLMIAFFNDTEATTHTIALSIYGETVHKLDSKYLDEEYIKSIVDEVISEALEGDY